jgi:hypothetical protein
LLNERRENVADLSFLALSTLHVQHRGLQHTAECRRLLRLPGLAPSETLDRGVEVLGELPAQLREVDAAGVENPFGVGIVRQCEEQMFESQVGMAARDRFPERDVQYGFYRG